MCKGGSSGSTVDPRLMSIIRSNYSRAQGVANTPYQPYTGQMTAGLTPTQQQAGGLLQSAPAMGAPALSTGVSAATAGTQYQAPLIQPGSYSATQATPGLMGAPAQVGTPNALSGLSSYENPYQQQVVDATMNDLNRQNQIALNNTNQSATAENAFGGDRNAVADSLTNDAYARAAASTLANLNSQGFNTAAGLLQNNQQMGQTAGIANMNAANSAGMFNAGNTQAANLFNAGAGNTASQFNLGQALNAALANQGAAGQAQGLNLQGAGLLGTLGNSQSADYLNGVNALNAWGGQQQQTNQNALTAAYQQYLAQMGYPIQMQQLLNGSLLGGAGTSSPTAGSSNFGNYLGGLTSLANSANSGGLLGTIGTGLGNLLGPMILGI